MKLCIVLINTVHRMLSKTCRKRRLKYIGAIGKHGFAVKTKYPREAINLTAYLGMKNTIQTILQSIVCEV